MNRTTYRARRRWTRRYRARAIGTSRRPSRSSGDAKVMEPFPGCGAGRRAIAASCPRWTGRRGGRGAGGARGRRGRDRGRPPRRTGCGGSTDEVSTRTVRPVSASMRLSSPTSGSSSSRGSRISTTSTPWRWATAPSCGSQSSGPRRSETRTTSPPAGAPWATKRRAASGDLKPASLPSDSSSTAASVISRPARPAVGRDWRSVGPPKVSTPSRLPRCVDRWPTAIATPSATSVLRRSAVPKAIDGETSSSSQEVSARSGTWTRTWGAAIRAVAFQSMRRTSSPGS